MDYLIENDCARLSFVNFLNDNERICLTGISKNIRQYTTEYVPNEIKFRTMSKPETMNILFERERQCYIVCKPDTVTFSGLYFYFSMYIHAGHGLSKWMKSKLKLPLAFERIKPNVLESILLTGIIQDIPRNKVDMLLKARMSSNVDDTFISSGFTVNQWVNVEKYLKFNSSIVKLIIDRPFENDTIINYFLDNNRPILSLDVSGDLCIDTLDSVMSCIHGLKELKIRNIDEINYSQIIHMVLTSEIEYLTIENTTLSSDITYLLKNNTLKELHLIDTFPIYPLDLISNMGSSGKLEKLSIKTSIRHRIKPQMVNLISCIPLFNSTLSEFDFSGIDMSNLNEYTISGIFKMKNLKKICLSYTYLNIDIVESICDNIVDTSIKSIDLEGIIIGNHSRLLFDSIRLNMSLVHVNLDKTILMANSYEFIQKCRRERPHTKITVRGCFSDPLIQKLFV